MSSKNTNKFPPYRGDFDYNPDKDHQLDPGIELYVRVLLDLGVETCQSCEGGEGHTLDRPWVQFWGDPYEGPIAACKARRAGLPVCQVARVWHVNCGPSRGEILFDSWGELDSPVWEMTFTRKATSEDSFDTLRQQSASCIEDTEEGLQSLLSSTCPLCHSHWCNSDTNGAPSQ